MAGPIFDDCVVETSTTTGTGDFTLAGAVTGFKTFDSRMTSGQRCYYLIEAIDGNGDRTGEWESGFGTYEGSGILDRTTVQKSSNADAAVNFSAGTKRVMISLTAAAKAHKGCLVKKSADHTSQNFTTATAIVWDTDVYDTHAFHDTGSNTSRITNVAGLCNYVELSGQVTLANLTADLWARLEIRLNGSAAWTGAGITTSEVGVTNPTINTKTAIVVPADADYWELWLTVETDTIIDIESDTSWFQLRCIQ